MTIFCKPRWERRKEARPQELLDAALDLFVERGFAATRLDDIAKRAGVSKGTLYLYYESKEELFKAVVRNTVIPLIGGAEQMVDQASGSCAQAFRNVVTTWWNAMGKTKLAGIAKLMMAEAGNFPELAAFYNEEVIARCDVMIVGILKRGIERGEFRQVDIERAPRILSAPVVMMMINMNSTGICRVDPDDADAHIAFFLDLTLRGLRA